MFKIQYTTDEDFIGRSRRPAAKTDDIIPIVRDVLVAVRDGGDKAVRELTLKFDKSCPDDLLVSPEELDAAEREVPDDLKKAIAVARENIEKFHRSQLPQKREYVETSKGVVCWQQAKAIDKVASTFQAAQHHCLALC